MRTLEVDVCFEHSDDLLSYENFANNHGVSVDQVLEHGPAGGNPLVRLTGPQDGIEAVLLEFHIQNDLGQQFVDDELAMYRDSMVDLATK